MATKDTNTGLLSKMAKFVRNPTTNWADLDSKNAEPDSGYSKQALKQMIERKRQNDFVRRREFDQLRKLRNRDPGLNFEIAGHPSIYPNSIPSNLDERAVTLKKIDEIEAQMSKQWWKGKQPDVAQDPVKAAPEPVDTGSDTNTDFALTQPANMVAEPEAVDRPQGGPEGARRADRRPERHSGPATLPSRSLDGAGSGFSTSKLFAVELSDDNTDPDLEEAAIRFANGDDAGAETGLLDALRGSEDQTESAEIWSAALFDLYRATGQQARFEDVAIAFAERFGRSAPAWFSMPGLLGAKTPVIDRTNVEEPALDVPVWECPAILDTAAMGALQLALASAPLPWFLNWSYLASIHPDAQVSVGNLFAGWCAQRVKLRFLGAQSVVDALKVLTPAGDKTVDQAWWQLRMDALRIMRLHDEFELVALDYCVTYEVSPPSWQDARCEYTSEGKGKTSVWAGGSDQRERDGVVPAASDAGGAPTQAYTMPMGLEDVPVVTVELTGEIVGDAADALKRLEQGRHQGAGRLVVSCATLVRVDFSAAGSILNWVANRENEGCNVEFRDVHRLVGAFFNVIGINEHARVVLRSN